jgi:hypothetical protein
MAGRGLGNSPTIWQYALMEDNGSRTLVSFSTAYSTVG